MENVKFKIRASACSEIMAGNIGLTDIQTAKLTEMHERKIGNGKPLTANMEVEYAELVQKRDNPELPQGAKTYCKKWLKEYLYKRRQEISSKYIRKGNLTEEQGFTTMAVQLKLGMVFKNEQYRENDYSTGTWDLFVGDTVYDNKSSWSLDTFPMFDLVNPKPEYEWQMQIYMGLAPAPRSVLAYTLNDAPEIEIQQAIRWVDDHQERVAILNNMIFTQEYFEAMKSKYAADSIIDFVPIPEEKRIKTFPFFMDNSVHYRIKERVKMCNSYINSLI
jgi:hypothetical protein